MKKIVGRNSFPDCMDLPSYLYCTMCRRGHSRERDERKMRQSRRYVMGRRAPRSRPASSSDDNNIIMEDDDVSVSSVDTTFLRRLIHSGRTDFIDNLVDRSNHLGATTTGYCQCWWQQSWCWWSSCPVSTTTTTTTTTTTAT